MHSRSYRRRRLSQGSPQAEAPRRGSSRRVAISPFRRGRVERQRLLPARLRSGLCNGLGRPGQSPPRAGVRLGFLPACFPPGDLAVQGDPEKQPLDASTSPVLLLSVATRQRVIPGATSLLPRRGAGAASSHPWGVWAERMGFAVNGCSAEGGGEGEDFVERQNFADVERSFAKLLALRALPRVTWWLLSPRQPQPSGEDELTPSAGLPVRTSLRTKNNAQKFWQLEGEPGEEPVPGPFRLFPGWVLPASPYPGAQPRSWPCG